MDICNQMQSPLKEYLTLLEKRYHENYDVLTNKVVSGELLDIYAVSVIEHFRNVLTKKIQFDQYQEREIILVKGFDQLVQNEQIRNFSQFLIQATRELVIPSFNVMSQTINGIVISSQGFLREGIESAQKFNYGRTFCLGIKGWCDIRLILIDLKESSVYFNAKGKEIAEVYAFRKEKGGDQKE